MITFKDFRRTKHRFTGRELELNAMENAYEYRLQGIYKRHKEEKSELMGIINELEKRIEELEMELA